MPRVSNRFHQHLWFHFYWINQNPQLYLNAFSSQLNVNGGHLHPCEFPQCLVTFTADRICVRSIIVWTVVWCSMEELSKWLPPSGKSVCVGCVLSFCLFLKWTSIRICTSVWMWGRGDPQTPSYDSPGLLPPRWTSIQFMEGIGLRNSCCTSYSCPSRLLQISWLTRCVELQWCRARYRAKMLCPFVSRTKDMAQRDTVQRVLGKRR